MFCKSPGCCVRLPSSDWTVVVVSPTSDIVRSAMKTGHKQSLEKSCNEGKKREHKLCNEGRKKICNEGRFCNEDWTQTVWRKSVMKARKENTSSAMKAGTNLQ
ncbi:hypothetical protein ACLOJK_018343 [Asimina triloba]